MDESRVSDAGDDAEDQIVSTAFASYRANAPKEFQPIPATALMTRAAARGRPRKRALTVSVAALACTGLMFAGVAVAQSVVGPSNTEDPPGANGSGGTNDDAGDQSQSSDSGSGGDSSQDPSDADLRGVSIELPAWEGLDDDCPAGTYVFSDDSSDVPNGQPSDAESADDPGEWSLLPDGSQAAFTDLDGDGDSEAVVPVACGEAPGVVALNRSADLMTSMGFVYVTDSPGSTVTIDEATGSDVTLNVGQGSPHTMEKRTFSYDDGEFTEGPQDDPSSDPSSPSEDPDETPSDEEDPTSEPDDEDEPTPSVPQDDSDRLPPSS